MRGPAIGDGTGKGLRRSGHAGAYRKTGRGGKTGKQYTVSSSQGIGIRAIIISGYG